jgi:ABC-type multidrug transport system fused ATPase/permease subunit
MRELRRVFQYVWPQWPRIIVVVLSAMVVALLISASFMTIIPLLTVMMGSEGLHGWVDRKTCEQRYGLEFPVPKAELSDDSDASFRPGLVIVKVRENSLAEKAGLRAADRITNVGDLAQSPDLDVSQVRLLAELAVATDETVAVEVVRPQADPATIELSTPHNQAYIERLDWSWFKHLRYYAQLAGLDAARWAVGFLPRGQTDVAVMAIMLLIVVITIVRCIAKFYQEYLGQKIVQVAINKLRADVFARVMLMPMAAFVRERPSDTVSRIVRDTTTMAVAIRVMLGKALREPLNALFMLGAAMLINWQLTLLFLCGGPFIVALLGAFGRQMKKATRRSLMAGSQMLAKLQESMTGLRVVKVYNQQKSEHERFTIINERLLKQQLRISKVEAATHPVLEVLGILAGSAAIIVGMRWVTGGGLEAPDFFALLGLLGASAEAVRKTSDIWNKIQQANAAAERVFAVMERPIEEERPGATALPPLKTEVAFRDVVFTYPGAERPALKGVNLMVSAGHNVAIVGPNGSGKTTLANLLPRFYDPDSGQVLVDGRDIRDVTLESLRGQIGMVTQELITFNDTIAANIGYGRIGATQEEIVAAAKRAFAHEFISRLPQGYETVIGEHGVGLSGGQLQRVVIARAILKNPAILIFDEATSQVDADSEAKIHRAIEEIMQDRTTFIIAHRFSTVVAADMIVVMDGGRIIAQGQHEELMKKSGVYQGLYETQLVKA